MWFLSKIITIYANKRVGFNYKNNYNNSKLAYI